VTESITALAPQLVDRYRIERELGAGGMATVYLAEDVRHRRKVAVKVLHPELSAVLGGDRFLNEIELTANLQHPHILPLFDSGSADGLLYYVMPYVGGETLRGRLQREHQLPLADALRIAAEVGDALAYAHKRGVVHRDIKPENILLQDGRAIVADFGIALAVQHAGGTRMTQTGMSLGTPQYMAPEQAMGDKAVDHRADIYALAAVTYEMLTGEPPFTGPTPQAILARVVTSEPKPPDELRRTIPQHVSWALLTGLQKLPADRQASAEEFVAALKDASAPTLARGAQPAGPATRRRSKAVAAAAAAALLAIGVAAGWAVSPRAATDRVGVQFTYQTDSTHFVATGCCGYQLAISPDERHLAYVGMHGGLTQIYVRQLDELAAHAIPGTEGAVEVFYSPDGRWLGFRARPGTVMRMGRDYELKKVPARGGAPVMIASASGWPYGATWLADGRIVFAGDSVLYAVPSDGGEPVRVGSPDSSYRYPSAIAGTDMVIFSRFSAMRRPDAASAAPAIGLLDLGSGRESIVTEGTRAVYSRSGHLTFGRGLALVTQRFDVRKRRTTGSPTTITDEMSRPIDFDASASGVLVYQSGRGGGAMDIVEDGQARHVPIPIDATHYDNPRVSPDGRRIAFAVGTSPGHLLAVHDIASRTNLRLTFSGGDHEHVSWMPDGRNLIYASDSAVLIQPADRSGAARQLLTLPQRFVQRLSVGGDWLAFAAVEGGAGARSEIYISPLRNPAPRRYQESPFSEGSPALSPNGRWLAYTSSESGRSEVYVSSVPTPGAREVVSTNGGAEPVWSRDGRALYFRTQDGTVIAASLGAGDQPRIVSRQVVFQSSHDISENAADYDVFPDGRRFVMLRSTRLGAPLVLMTDAFRRLSEQ
jgi:eukaryotic-like serine/threonine-protein kinase